MNAIKTLKGLNVADWLSISRLVATPILIAVVVWGSQDVFKWGFLIFLTTDFIDGQIARRFHMTSKHGARLDSAGDAAIFCTGLVGIFYYETEFVRSHAFVIGTALLLYLVQLVYAFIKYGRPSSFHTYSAKTAAFFQGVFMLTVFFFDIWEWLFWITLIISIIEEVEEIILIYRLPDYRTDVKGIYWELKNQQ